MVLFFAIPVLLILGYSFLSRNEFGEVINSFTLQNYSELISSGNFGVLVRTLKISSLAGLICTTLSFIIAYYVYKHPRHNLLIISIISIPYLVNFLIRSYAWIDLLGREGMLNSTLLSIGIINEPIRFLFTESAIIFGFVFNLLPVSFFYIYLRLRSMNPALEQVASDLGAPQHYVLRRVVLPQVRQGLYGAFIVVFIISFGDFVVPELFGGGRVLLLGNLIKTKFLALRNWPLGSAMTCFILLFSAVFLIINSRRNAAETQK